MNMTNLNKHMIKLYILGILMLSLTACKSGGGSADTSTTAASVTDSVPTSTTGTTISGYVADGYLFDAQVFLDRNLNHVYDQGEPMAYSDQGGHYSLEVEAGDGDLYPVVVNVVAGQTVDQDSGLFAEESYVLESPPGHGDFVSPLTTLVNIELDKNPSYSLEQAELKVRTRLGIADQVSLFDNYLDNAGASTAVSQEFKRSHRVAQVVANLMGLLRSDIKDNLGRSMTTAEEELLAYMVSDQIEQHADLIKAAMEYERNYSTTTVVDDLVSSLYSQVAITTLNEDLLELYSQRVSQGFDIWDMSPPQVVSDIPELDENASIQTTISVTFDEALDASRLDGTIFEVIGPNGVVSGTLTYDAEHYQLVFTPEQSLLPYADYEVVIKAALADEIGNKIGEDISWMFVTTFDQIPPTLPEFL